MMSISPLDSIVRVRLSASFLVCSLALAACGSSNSDSAPLDDDLVPAIAAKPILTFHSVKTFRFSWSDLSDATHYKLLENPDGMSGFTQVGANVVQGTELINHIVPLYARTNAQYILQSCTNSGCIGSNVVSISGTLEDSIGVVTTDLGGFGSSASLSAGGKTLAIGGFGEERSRSSENGIYYWAPGAVHVFTRLDRDWIQQADLLSATADESDDSFGHSVSMSADGNTLAVGTIKEDSAITGADGDWAGNDWSGAVYVFTRSGSDWRQEAYIKASNSEEGDMFGFSVSLSADGNTLTVAAQVEASSAVGINGNQSDNTAGGSGAVYVLTRSGSEWSQEAYIKASNSDAGDLFGWSISLSSDGNTLAVGASGEASNSFGVNGVQSDNSSGYAGAVYLFKRSSGAWTQEAYLKASNTDAVDKFGNSVSLSADGNTLAVGAQEEDSNAIGINGNQSYNSAGDSGAVYVFTRSVSDWSQEAYIKASNADADDQFGEYVSLSADGNLLAITARLEDGGAIGVNGNQDDNSAENSGAVYVFTRDSGDWIEQAYLKAKEMSGVFGWPISLSADGNTLAVGGSGGVHLF